MPPALISGPLAQVLRFARALAWVALVGGVLAAGLLVLPFLVDWQPYKPRLAVLLGEATGRTVAIDGPIDLALLPRPAIRLADVTLANVAGTPERYRLEARRVTALLSWRALLGGRVEVVRVALDEPRVSIWSPPDGTANWWLPALDRAHGDSPPLVPLSVDRIEVRRGRLFHATGLVGQRIEAEAVDLVARLDGAGIRIQASGLVNGVPVTTALGLRTAVAAAPPVTLTLDAPGGRLSFAGWAGERTAADPLHGKVTIAAAFLPEFVQSLSRLLGRPAIRLNEAVLRRIEASADIRLAGPRLAIDGLDATLADERVRGALQVAWDDGIAVSGRLVAPRVDADLWVQRLQDYRLLVPPPGTSDLPSAEGPAPRLQLAIEVGSVQYRRGTVRDLATSFRVEDGEFHLQELKAILPGDFRIHRRVGFEGDEAHPGYDGVIEVEARNLRETMGWIGIDTAAVPADRLRTMRLDGRTRPVKGVIHVSNATFALDGQPGTVSADVALAIPTVIAARLHMPRLDLDGYRLDPSAIRAMVPAAAADGGHIALPTFDIAARLEEVIYRGEPAREVDVRLQVRGNLLTLRQVGVGALLGAHLEISGSVSDFGTAPRFDLAWRGVLPDADRVLDYAGLPRFINGRIGPAQVAGKARGTLREVTLSGLSLAMLEATVHADGHVAFGDTLRFDFPRWTLAAHDIGPLVAVAGGTPRRPMAEIRAGGTLRGDSHHVSFQGDVSVDGMPLWGELSSTLDARPRIAASLRAPSGLRLDRWLPAPPGAGAARAVHAWSREAPPAAPTTGLSGLRAFDGSLSLVTPALNWGSYAMSDVRLSARLHHGVLEVERLSGSVAGSAIDLAGKIDASGSRILVETSGSVRDIDIARTIALAHTANDFGSDDLAVALEGKVSLHDLALRTEGDTLQELLVAATGSGRSESRIQPVVTRGSLSLATLATGIGSLFSTEMGFASAVIDNFVGRWIATHGAFSLEGGLLTLDEHTLRGPAATAYVTSLIDARRGTLDTTIRLDIGTPGSIDYTMSLRGPIDDPVLRPEPPGGR